MIYPDLMGAFTKLSKALSVIVSLVTLTSLIFGAVTTFTTELNDIKHIKEEYKAIPEQFSKLSDRIADINTQVIEMKITSARIEERLNLRDNSRK